MNDWHVLDWNVTFPTWNWPKYCKQPYLSEIPHAAETKYFTRDKICQDFALLQSVWSPPDRSSFSAILMVGHKCGHPDGAGERGGRCSDAEGWGAVLCSALEGAFVGTENHLDLSLGCTHLVLLLGNSQLKLFILAWFEMICVHCHFCVMLVLVIDQMWIITNLQKHGEILLSGPSPNLWYFQRIE